MCIIFKLIPKTPSYLVIVKFNYVNSEPVNNGLSHHHNNNKNALMHDKIIVGFNVSSTSADLYADCLGLQVLLV